MSLTEITGDGAQNRFVFPPEATIDAWGHCVVFCKNGGSPGPELYALFELPMDGETLVLANPEAVEIDRVDFPPLPADVSFARFLDGARFFAYNPSPTLGQPNLRPANLDPTVERKDPFVGPGASCLGLTGRVFDDVAVAYAAVCFRLAGDSHFTELPMSDTEPRATRTPEGRLFRSDSARDDERENHRVLSQSGRPGRAGGHQPGRYSGSFPIASSDRAASPSHAALDRTGGSQSSPGCPTNKANSKTGLSCSTPAPSPLASMAWP